MEADNCSNCVYAQYLRSVKMNCCRYFLMTGQIRPCPAGAGCTVKVGYRKRSYPKKKKEE